MSLFVAGKFPLSNKSCWVDVAEKYALRKKNNSKESYRASAVEKNELK